MNPLDPVQWVDEFGDALFRYAVAKVSNRDVAEDLVQETFLAALAGRKSFRGESAQLTWFISILRRKIFDHFRRRDRDLKLAEESAEEVARESDYTHRKSWYRNPNRWPIDSEVVLEQQEFWAVFEDCLSLLPPNLAEAFRLCEAEEVDFQTVSNKLKISASNLSVRLHRARLSLRSCLELKWFKN